MWSCWLNCLWTFLTGSAAVYIFGALAAAFFIRNLVRQRNEARLEKLRRKWNSVGRDVVVLHQFPRGRTCPNGSPYPIKLETYLRMAGIKYENDFEEFMSPKGKSPWITINGEDIADSQLAIEHLTKVLKKDVDAHLNEEEKARARSIRIMVEEHFYWCIALERWVYDRSDYLTRVLPPFNVFNLPKSIDWWIFINFTRKMVKDQGHGAGLGRHTRSEVEKMGIEDLEAISQLLGSKPFLMGDQPSLVDCTLFGFMNMLVYCPAPDSVYIPLIKTKCANLIDHTNRMREKFWPDFEQVLYKD